MGNAHFSAGSDGIGVRCRRLVICRKIWSVNLFQDLGSFWKQRDSRESIQESPSGLIRKVLPLPVLSPSHLLSLPSFCSQNQMKTEIRSLFGWNVFCDFADLVLQCSQCLTLCRVGKKWLPNHYSLIKKQKKPIFVSFASTFEWKRFFPFLVTFASFSSDDLTL